MVEIWVRPQRDNTPVGQYVQRVTADGGTVEATECLRTEIRRLLGLGLFNEAKLVLVGSGYKAGTLYSVKPFDGSGDWSVVRAGATATRVNSARLIEGVAANVPRLDFTGGGCPALLVEGASQNILQRSNEFSNAYWNKIFVTVPTSALPSPDGTNNAFKLTENASLTDHYTFFPAGLFTAPNTYSLSVFARPRERGFLWLYIYNGLTSRFAWFNLNTGEIGTEQAGITAHISPLLANGYYYCSISRTITGAANANGGIGVSNADNVIVYLGDGTSGIDIYGAQAEIGLPTSYIPTTTTAVTRNADVITVSPPSGVTEIITTFEDNTTQVVTSIPGTFTLPKGRIKSVVMI